MSLTDSNVKSVKNFEQTGSYWTNQITSIGNGILLETKGYKTLIISIISTITGVTKINTKAVFKGNNANNYGILQLLNENGYKIDIPRGGDLPITTGTTLYKIDVSKLTSVGFGLNIFSGTASVSLNYQLTNDDISVNFPLKNFYTHFDNSKLKIEVNKDFDLKIAAMYQDVVAYTNWYASNILYVSLNGRTDNPYSIAYNSTNFPNLITGSTIAHVLIVPYKRDGVNESWRLSVISNKGQIHHNFPARAIGSEATSLAGDEYLFDESVVWDLETRKFPSKTVDSSIYQLNPCLPDASYLMYPPISTDNGYGNGGFADSITVSDEKSVSHTYPRFYIHNRTVVNGDGGYSNPFKYMGGMEYSSKLTLIGTYAQNRNGSAYRIVVIASSDGGRSWFCKYEFGDTTPSSGLGSADVTAWGNAINGGAIASSWNGGTVNINKRVPIVPIAGAEEPSVPFTHGTNIVVTSIGRTSPLTITTATAHGFANGEMVFLSGTPTSSDFNFLMNNTASPTSIGNGVFFKANVINSTQVTLYEQIHNPANNIYCRHIHHINRIKDGFTLGCGEAHPQGWMFFIPILAADGTTMFPANNTMTFIRLNSAKAGLQRSLGFIIKDDVDSTILFGSDNEFTERTAITIPNRTVAITRNSTGVFKGKLADIDDMNKFKCILETPQVLYFFKKKLGALIAIGDNGYFAISFDDGETWTEVQLPVELYGASRFLGTSYKREIGIEGMIITLK